MFGTRFLSTIAALGAGALFVVAFVSSADAQRGPCTTRAEVISWLGDRFDERPAGFGLIGGQAVLELFRSSEGTWTVIVTDRQKKTCLVAAGDSWVDLDPPATPASAGQ